MVYEAGEFDPDEIVHDDFGLSFEVAVHCPACFSPDLVYNGEAYVEEVHLGSSYICAGCGHIFSDVDLLD